MAAQDFNDVMFPFALFAPLKFNNYIPKILRLVDFGEVEIFTRATGFSKELSHPFARLMAIKLDIGKKEPLTEIGRTEQIGNTQNPEWTKPFTTDYHFEEVQKYRFEIWDVNHQLQGTCDFCLAELMTAPDFILGKTLQPLGNVRFEAKEVTRNKITFVDYLKSGWELNMMIGIDFTGSNKRPDDPRSLHYRSGVKGEFNQYEHAIMSLGEVISQYDHDGLYPVYGFGGRLPNHKVSHCFPLTQTPENPMADPSVKDLEGILDIYANALTTWGLSGPTNFAPIINVAVDTATKEAETSSLDHNNTYTILLMITDGIITDLEQTKTAIVAASKLPLSIIIVGVGDADFSDMDVLDSDDQLLQDNQGNKATRDIVQFVPFNKFKDTLGFVNSHAKLAKATLEELPGQMMGYFNDNNIVPRGTDGLPAPQTPPKLGYRLIRSPQGAEGGDKMRVEVDGREVIVQIPMGTLPGEQFSYQIPSRPPLPP